LSDRTPKAGFRRVHPLRKTMLVMLGKQFGKPKGEQAMHTWTLDKQWVAKTIRESLILEDVGYIKVDYCRLWFCRILIISCLPVYFTCSFTLAYPILLYFRLSPLSALTWLSCTILKSFCFTRQTSITFD